MRYIDRVGSQHKRCDTFNGSYDEFALKCFASRVSVARGCTACLAHGAAK